MRRGTLARAVAAALLVALSAGSAARAIQPRRLTDGWEHYQGSLGSTWEVWRGDKASDNDAKASDLCMGSSANAQHRRSWPRRRVTARRARSLARALAA